MTSMSGLAVPSLFFGEHKDVFRAVKKCVGSASTPPQTDGVFGPLLDVASKPLAPTADAEMHLRIFGRAPLAPLIMVNSGGADRTKGEHCRMYCLKGAFFRRDADIEAWYRWCFASEWRFLAVLGDGSIPLFGTPLQKLLPEYLAACLAYADRYEALGARFASVSAEPESFTAPDGILALTGSTAAEVGGPEALVAKVLERVARK